MMFGPFFIKEHERRLAQEEAAAAVERHDERAPGILLMKARTSPHRNRRRIYRLAAKEALSAWREKSGRLVK